MLDLLAGWSLILAITVAATWIVSLFFAATVAGEKGYIGFAWGLLGLIFGPIVLHAAVGLPDRKDALTNREH